MSINRQQLTVLGGALRSHDPPQGISVGIDQGMFDGAQVDSGVPLSGLWFTRHPQRAGDTSES